MAKKICIIMGEITGDYRDQYITGVEKQANRLGYETTIFSLVFLNRSGTHSEEKVYDLIDFSKYDGVIFAELTFSAYKSLGRAIGNRIKNECKVPVVSLGRSEYVDECFSSDNSVDYEYLTDHVIEEHDARLLYFLGGNYGETSGRAEGFMNSLRKHGIECTGDNMLYGGFWSECADKLADDLADGTMDIPDAVMCFDDQVAFFLIRALSKHGIRVPDDLIVCGFGERTISTNNIVSITTYPGGTGNIGRRAVIRLHHLITGEPEIGVSGQRPAVITGMSCGCGSHMPLDIRQKFQLDEKKSEQMMYYANCSFREKFFVCENYGQLSQALYNLDYIIPDKCFFALNIMKNSKMAECIFMTQEIDQGNPTAFEASDVVVEKYAKNWDTKNIFVLPLAFNNKFLGFVAVGYQTPILYNNFLRYFTNELSLFLEIINLRNNSDTQKESKNKANSREVIPEKVQAESDIDDKLDAFDDSKKDLLNDTILITHNGVLHKIPVENILYFESEGRKSIAVLKTGRYEVNKSLIELEATLPEKNFFRCSKSCIVNMSKITGYTQGDERKLVAILAGKLTVSVSRKNAQEFRERYELM